MRRSRWTFAVAVLGLAVACRTTRTAGGVIIRMSLDKTLTVSSLTELRVEIDPSIDAGSAYYYKETFGIPQHLSQFPTTLAIQSNGNPSASVAVTLGVWNKTTAVDVRQYQVVDVPSDAVTEFDVTFSAQCSPALAHCAAGLTCCTTAAGVASCASDVVDGAQPTVACRAPVDGGAGDSDAEAGPPEASTDDGGPFDATVDDAGDADDADDASNAEPPPPLGYDGGTSCEPPCHEVDTHCVGSTCVAVPPSCAGGGPGAGFNCGGFFGTTDCCETLDVPLTASDSFFRDYELVPSMTFLDQTNPAKVSQFSLDVYEVTVGRFRKFVNAVVGADGGAPWVPPQKSGLHGHLPGGGLNAGGNSMDVHETGWDSSWDAHLPTTKAGWDARLSVPCESEGDPPQYSWSPDVDTTHENLPITCIDWFAAYAFCIWDGGFLPSATEWDFAAAGGRSQRSFAWGDSPPPNNSVRAIYHCIFGVTSGQTFLCTGLRNLADVGYPTEGQALWGQMDMTGSAFEWTLDYYGSYPNPCSDCANFQNGDERVYRGGGYQSPTGDLYNAAQGNAEPDLPYQDRGVRCARPPY